MALKTDYKDYVASGKKKYVIVENGDGTVSLDDVTKYTQTGSKFAASDINSTNLKVNDNEKKLDDETKTRKESIDAVTKEISNLTTNLNSLTESFNSLKDAFDALGLCVIDGKVCQKVKVNE